MTRRTAAVGRAALRVTVVAAPRWQRAARGLGPWLVRAAPARARGSVAVALVGDREVRGLNRRFRNKDAPTDVLSFPAGPNHVPAAVGNPSRTVSRKSLSVRHLGDIAIATGVARRQAAALGHSVGVEIRILALHGLLHLLGYDHERDQGQMQRLEARLRRRTHLPMGLLDRTPDRRPRR